MPLPLTDAELAMLHALAAPIDANRRPEFMGAVEKELEAGGRLRSGRARCTGPRAPSYEVSGPRRRISGRAGWGLEALAIPETRAGGEGGIRTHGRLAPTEVFKTSALSHSATSPNKFQTKVGTRLARVLFLERFR
jgi:hypothetical protein